MIRNKKIIKAIKNIEFYRCRLIRLIYLETNKQAEQHKENKSSLNDYQSGNVRIVWLCFRKRVSIETCTLLGKNQFRRSRVAAGL